MQDTYVFRGSANKTEGIISSFAVSPLLFVTGLNTGNRVKRENAIVSNWTRVNPSLVRPLPIFRRYYAVGWKVSPGPTRRYDLPRAKIMGWRSRGGVNFPFELLKWRRNSLGDRSTTESFNGITMFSDIPSFPDYHFDLHYIILTFPGLDVLFFLYMYINDDFGSLRLIRYWQDFTNYNKLN